MQKNLYTRVEHEAEDRAERRKKLYQAEKESKWGISSKPGIAVTESKEWQDELRNARALALEFGEQVDKFSSDFWDALNSLIESIRPTSLENLQFLLLRLDFNNFYG